MSQARLAATMGKVSYDTGATFIGTVSALGDPSMLESEPGYLYYSGVQVGNDVLHLNACAAAALPATQAWCSFVNPADVGRNFQKFVSKRYAYPFELGAVRMGTDEGSILMVFAMWIRYADDCPVKVPTSEFVLGHSSLGKDRGDWVPADWVVAGASHLTTLTLTSPS